jgi:DNA-binding NtrC family response regulator
MTMTKPTLLVVDDEPDMLQMFRSILGNSYKTLTAGSGEAALKILKKETPDLVLLDIRMPNMDGVTALKMIKELDRDLDVIVVTASKEVKSAVECIKLGAYDYVTKPFEADELKVLIKKALERKEILLENVCLKNIIASSDKFCEFIGKAQVMKDIFGLIEEIGKVDSTVLVRGESGTGKELVAKAIHRKSERREKPFVTINCAAIPDNLLESELFGFEAGSFTGALEKRLGKFELASGGTIFLDEIGCMSPNTQAKILRVLEDRSIDRIGGRSPIPTDVRIISATNINFEEAVSSGKFREDLYYRLNVIPIVLPPLRERREDIPLLIHHFIQKFNTELNKKVQNLSEEAMLALMAYSWPGNVRELRNMIERLVALSKNGTITHADLPINENGTVKKALAQNQTLDKAMASFEREALRQTLEQTSGNQTRAARILGIHRTTLLSKMRWLGLK